MFGMWSKIDVPSREVNMRSNRLVLIDSEHGLQYKYFNNYELR